MLSHRRLSFRRLAPGVCVLLFCNVFLSAQNLPARIDVVVIEGEGVVHKASQRAARSLVVRVEDDDHRPLTGASVVFALPVSGASGEFINGSKTLTAVTDGQGLAAAHGFRTNQVAGKLQIYVTASYRGLRANALISQEIEGAPVSARTPVAAAGKPGGKWKWIALGAVAAGAAGGGVYFGTRNKSSVSSPITIITGAVVFGSPR
jgi:hypothetical protein